MESTNSSLFIPQYTKYIVLAIFNIAILTIFQKTFKPKVVEDIEEYNSPLDQLWCGPEPKESIETYVSDAYCENQLLEEIQELKKKIYDVEDDLRKISTPPLSISGIPPSYYRLCIECLLKRDIYPEIFGRFNCTCTSAIEFETNKNHFGIITCICNPIERPIIGYKHSFNIVF